MEYRMVTCVVSERGGTCPGNENPFSSESAAGMEEGRSKADRDGCSMPDGSRGRNAGCMGCLPWDEAPGPAADEGCPRVCAEDDAY